MEITNKNIDGGNTFDWGRTSKEYAKYRDIYPDAFYERILARNLCVKGQKVLDLGTGTGVLPRNMYRYGAEWTGADISENQIAEAERLSKEHGMHIKYMASPTEDIHFPPATFDVITACQCFWYFDHQKVAPMLAGMLKKDGRLLILYMAWLPFQDEIARSSEELVLKYNPAWSGAGETKHPIHIPDCVYEYFDPVFHEEYDIMIEFTRETWHGRMKACRGVGASLPAEKLASWETEHTKLLEETAPDSFEVRHYAALAELKVKR
ncbi:class I SAM-dependent methyltransferase [Candidatus Soleaferrea massiliensis]|uniref:class I SAM-dependent methyltransferase n=1 Tax=Candidatus Soleaferrea massiliensis TaxID=1470354 RepID=UPI00058E27E9|nr:class I SAM-dependent methyltransferase [Candidatus Soleaferrea massiliensis]